MTQTDPGVERARANIGDLKIAVRKEKDTLKDYRDRIETGRGGYPVAGLQHGIERCEHNIRVLKTAIIAEHENITSMEGQQKIREEMAKLREGIEIPVEYVNAGEEEAGEVH